MENDIFRKVLYIRCNTEEEAKARIEAIRKETGVDPTKTTITHKTKKSKGEVIEDWFSVLVQLDFWSEAEGGE